MTTTGGESERPRWWLRREAMIYMHNMLHDESSEPASGAAVPEAGDNGKPEKSPGNLRVALGKLGVALWYDELAQRPMVDGLGVHSRELDDAGMRDLWLRLEEECGQPWGYGKLVRFLLAMAEEAKVHPVREYLAGLNWDGVPRLDAWLSTYLGAKDTPYTREVGRCVLLAAVARVRQPGCKFDEMMILEGHNGVALSLVVRFLISKDKWFAESAPIAARGTGATKTILGKWIFVDTLLHSVKRSDPESLHSLLSRSQDRIRVGSRLKDYPRQCIFIGTTSEKTYLKEANRRFWPVETGNINPSRLANDHNQLWAEAAHRQGAGESICMDESVWAAAAIEQEKRRIPE